MTYRQLLHELLILTDDQLQQNVITKSVVDGQTSEDITFRIASAHTTRMHENQPYFHVGFTGLGLRSVDLPELTPKEARNLSS